MGAKVIGIIAILVFYSFCFWLIYFQLPGRSNVAVGFLETLSIFVFGVINTIGLTVAIYYSIKWALGGGRNDK